jgi:hypothetical protein
LSSLLTKKQDTKMAQNIDNKQDARTHLLGKLSVGAVSGWRYFSSQKPKLNSDLEIVWSDGTEDIFRWIKPNIEQLDFDIDCRPIKWRYACR